MEEVHAQDTHHQEGSFLPTDDLPHVTYYPDYNALREQKAQAVKSEPIQAAYFINPSNIKLVGPDQYVNEHDFYEGDVVLENAERLTENFRQEIYDQPFKLIELIKSCLGYQVENRRRENLEKLRDVLADIEFRTKKEMTPESIPNIQIFADKNYSVSIAKLLMEFMTITLDPEFVRRGPKECGTPQPHPKFVNNSQAVIYSMYLILKTLCSDDTPFFTQWLSPTLILLCKAAMEVCHRLNIVKCQEISDKAKAEKARRKRQKREKYLKKEAKTEPYGTNSRERTHGNSNEKEFNDTKQEEEQEEIKTQVVQQIEQSRIDPVQ